MKLKRWPADRWIASGLIIVAAWYLVMAWRLPRFSMSTMIDANVFPIALGCGQMFVAAWLWFKPEKADQNAEKSEWAGLDVRQGGLMLLTCLLYIEIMLPLGFVISTFSFLIVTPYILGWRRWGVSCFTALLVAIGIYCLMVFGLGVVLPRGIMPF